MGGAERLRRLLRERVVFLDGAMGTELMKRGMPPGAPTEEWALENIDVLSSVHSDYVSSGADIVLACTFGGTAPKLEGRINAADINERLAEVALQAAGDSCIAAASVGPSGALIHPSGTTTWIEAYGFFREQADALVRAGMNVFFLETFSDPRELKAAALAARDACPDGFISAQMTFEPSGLSLSGTSPTALAALLEQLPVDAAGANCSGGPEELLPVVQEMLRTSPLPVAVEPNAGLPVNGEWDMTPERFAGWLEDMAWSGASLLGGCCGTGPEHVREYVTLVGRRPPESANTDSLRLLTSVDRTVTLGEGLLTVGESINPTGRRSLRRSISEGDFLSVVSLGRAQGRADVIDINLGLEKLLPEGFVHEVFSRLSIGPPLSVDLSGPENIEAAFRELGGIGILNSLIPDERFIEERVGAILRHGGYAVLLPLGPDGPPGTAEERLSALERGIAILREHGLPEHRILADPIVTPLERVRGAAPVMQTLSAFKRRGLLTIAGISNVSHGMPDRSSLNSVLLISLAALGLDLAIVDVLDPVILDARRNIRMLTGDIEPVELKLPEFDPVGPSPDFMAILGRSITVGDRTQTEAAARELLESGTGAVEILERGLAPAMRQVGDLYRRRKLFLPHLIASAEASEVLTRLLAPHLEREDAPAAKGSVVLASVRGDVHDIGKNLVGLFLRNAGFEVTDLGKDVDSRVIVDRAVESDADIIALSALMSTTAPEMEKVIALARESGCNAAVLVGGAVVTREYAEMIGADGYAADAVRAAAEAARLMGNGDDGGGS